MKLAVLSTIRLFAALLVGAFGCYADPIGPASVLPVQLSVQFINQCGFMAAFELYTDDTFRGMYIIEVGGDVEKSVSAGEHSVRYLAIRFHDVLVPVPVHHGGGPLTVQGRTPYPMVCE